MLPSHIGIRVYVYLNRSGRGWRCKIISDDETSGVGLSRLKRALKQDILAGFDINMFAGSLDRNQLRTPYKRSL